jgi:diadenosine tetraphosphate (Ap4A) HIT family hydrolase
VAYLNDDQVFLGWTILVLKRHATELFHLVPEERRQLMEEVTDTARALASILNPVKINYELLGNQLPHIHWHIIPRLAGDPAPLEPVWRVTHAPRQTGNQERHELMEQIRRQLIIPGVFPAK